MMKSFFPASPPPSSSPTPFLLLLLISLLLSDRIQQPPGTAELGKIDDGTLGSIRKTNS